MMFWIALTLCAAGGAAALFLALDAAVRHALHIR
jgi:hypothetical protein